jgi:hypothetical protein
MVSDAEGHKGRKEYARNVTGAYYSARLAVLEHLLGAGRQATVVVYREVTEEYWAPLGVWVIREGVRTAMSSEARVMESIDDAVREVSSMVRVKDWYRSSQHIRDAKAQTRIEDFGSA